MKLFLQVKLFLHFIFCAHRIYLSIQLQKLEDELIVYLNIYKVSSERKYNASRQNASGIYKLKE